MLIFLMASMNDDPFGTLFPLTDGQSDVCWWGRLSQHHCDPKVFEAIRDREQDIISAIGTKYPQEMFHRYEQRHREGHRESGKSNCPKPNSLSLRRHVEFSPLEMSSQPDGTVLLRLKGVIFLEGHRRSCRQGIGKITISLSSLLIH